MLWGRLVNVNIRNNIFYDAERFAITRYEATISSCNIDHNMIYGSSAPQVIMDASGCSVHDNRIGLDPMFVEATKEPYDFHLRAGSPAIGTGAAPATVPTDFDGLSRSPVHPDVGAFAFHAMQ
jgi:hypothetical protein